VIRLAGPSHSSVITAYWLDGPHPRIAEEFEGQHGADVAPPPFGQAFPSAAGRQKRVEIRDR